MLRAFAARAVHSVCTFDVWKGNSRLTARTLPNKNNVAREVKFALWGKSLYFLSRRVRWICGLGKNHFSSFRGA